MFISCIVSVSPVTYIFFCGPFFRFCAEDPQVELLEISGEPRGESSPLLADGRAHGQHSRGGDGDGARNHPEETGGAMMRLDGGG